MDIGNSTVDRQMKRWSTIADAIAPRKTMMMMRVYTLTHMSDALIDLSIGWPIGRIEREGVDVSLHGAVVVLCEEKVCLPYC